MDKKGIPDRATHLRNIFAAVAIALIFSAPGAAAQGDECAVDGMNIQCNAFGTLMVANQVDVRGEPAKLEVTAELATTYRHQDTRWLLFAVRHTPESGESPVDFTFSRFYSDFGDVLVEKVEQPTPNELNVWVQVLDMPVATPVTLEVDVRAAERGAFRVETFAMPFDRGYATIQDAKGDDVILFTFSILGVNEKTTVKADDGAGFSTPLGAVLPVAAVAAALLVASRRRQQ